jgi:hypothetical protein
MPGIVLCRRNLIATAIGGGAAWFGRRVSFRCARIRSFSGPSPLATLCSGWSYPNTIGRACLEALPTIEASKAFLTRIILGDIRAGAGDCSSRSVLVRKIRQRSREDFRDGRIVTVDGWMLSLTETRVYALAALLAQPHESFE